MKVKVLNSQTQVEVRELNLENSIDRAGECLLGRSPHSGLTLDSPDVSRLHGKFALENGQYYFYDLGSSNGSLVNGKLVQPNHGYLLKPGDIIRVGEFVLILYSSEPAPELAATVVGDPNATIVGWNYQVVPPAHTVNDQREVNGEAQTLDAEATETAETKPVETPEPAELIETLQALWQEVHPARAVGDYSVSESSSEEPLEKPLELESIASESIASTEPQAVLSQSELDQLSEVSVPIEIPASIEAVPEESIADQLSEPLFSEPTVIQTDESIDRLELANALEEPEISEGSQSEVVSSQPTAGMDSEESVAPVPASVDWVESFHSPHELSRFVDSIDPSAEEIASDSTVIQTEEQIAAEESIESEPMPASAATVIQPDELIESVILMDLVPGPAISGEVTVIQSDWSDESIEPALVTPEPALVEPEEDIDLITEPDISESSLPYMEDRHDMPSLTEVTPLIFEPPDHFEATVIQSADIETEVETDIKTDVDSEVESLPIIVSETATNEWIEQDAIPDNAVASPGLMLETDEPDDTDEQLEMALTAEEVEEAEIAELEQSETYSAISLRIDDEPTFIQTDDSIAEPLELTEERQFSIEEEPSPWDEPISAIDQESEHVIDQVTNQVISQASFSDETESTLDTEESPIIDTISQAIDASKQPEFPISHEPELIEPALAIDDSIEDEAEIPIDREANEANQTAAFLEHPIAISADVPSSIGQPIELAVSDSQSPEATEESRTRLSNQYIALLAHDNQKTDLVELVRQHKDFFSQCQTIATPSVSELLRQEVGLEISQQTPAMPPGGYQFVNSWITSGKILAVIFLRDFFMPQATQANDEAFSRSCNIHQVLLANNRTTAEAIVHYIQATVVANSSRD